MAGSDTEFPPAKKGKLRHTTGGGVLAAAELSTPEPPPAQAGKAGGVGKAATPGPPQHRPKVGGER